MTADELVVIVLSSSVLASIVTVFLGGIVNRALKKLDYADEYYKTVLNRRIETYEVIEGQISLLKTSALGDDGRPYHLIFAYGVDAFHKFMAGMSEGMVRGLWLSNEVQKALVEINHEILDVSFRAEGDDGLIALGQERYERFAELRHKLERAFIADMKVLHEVKKFLSSKHDSEHKFMPFSVAQKAGATQREAPADARPSRGQAGR